MSIGKAKEDLACGAAHACERCLKKEIKENKTVMKGNLDAAFTYFANLLDPSREHDWEVICACECDTVGYVNRGGVIIKGVVRGHSFESLCASLCAWLLKFYPYDEAKFQVSYMTNTLVFNADKDRICNFCECVMHMNSMLAVIPTQKDVGGKPPEMNHGNKPLTPNKLCQVLLG